MALSAAAAHDRGVNMTMSETHTTEDPVVVYDTMRESATRLMAEYNARITVGGIEDPAMQEMRSILAQAEAVDAHDIAAQKKATAKFNARYESLSES
jgi:hypothetical protein